MKNGKRILAVKLIRESDIDFNSEDRVGTFDMVAKSEYAIPMEHWDDTHGYRYDGGFKFYNGPVDNYSGEPSEDIRTYIQQDYEQMRRYNSGEFYYVGVRAIAEIVVGHTVQRISSGGIWGIESDCEDYLKETEQEELRALKAQLVALGFGKRAIATAFKDAKQS